MEPVEDHPCALQLAPCPPEGFKPPPCTQSLEKQQSKLEIVQRGFTFLTAFFICY